MCAKICPDHTDDLWQETLLILLEYNAEKLLTIYNNGKLKFFVCKILMNQAHSNTSPFHKNYRNPNTNITDFNAIQFMATLDEMTYSDENNLDITIGSNTNKLMHLIDNQYDTNIDKLIDGCLTEISIYASEDDNNWYRAELFKLYLQEGSIRKLSNKTEIPVMSIQRSLNEFKMDIKQRMNENTSHPTVKPSERDKLLQAINATRLSEDPESGNSIRSNPGLPL